MKNKFLVVISFLYITCTGLLVADSQPIMSRLYGDSFVAGVDQYQALGTTGSLDDSWGINGSLDVNNSITTPQAKAVQTLSDGSVVVLLNSSANNNSYLVKYTATGALYSTTGGTFGTSSMCTLTNYAAPVSSIVVDTQGRFIVVGGRDYNDAVGNRLWIQRVTPAGSLDGTFTFDDQASWGTSAYAVSVQSSGKILVVGLDAGTSSIKMGRYLSTGVLDTSFGSSGYVLFDGTGGLPSSTAAILSFAVDADDSIYVAYTLSGTNYGSLAKFNADGSLATGFGTTGVVSFALGGTPVVVGSTGCVLDVSGNIVAFGKVGNDIKLYCYAAVDGSAAGFTSYTITDASDDLYAQKVVATTDGNLLVIGFNDTDTKMRIDSITSAGAHDTDFNSNGIQEFSIGSPSTSSVLSSGSIAPDGRLFVAGHQADSDVIAYVSRLFNVPYVSQVAQYPSSTQQGEVDLTFGLSETQDGVLRLFNGVYGASLQQKAQTVIELASEKLLVGMSGKLDTSNNSNMMLRRLNADGTIDVTFNLNKIFTNEYLSSVVEDNAGNLYVAGYTTTNAIIRKYDSSGNLLWGNSEGDQTVLGVGLALQGTQRVLLFGRAGAPEKGMITAFNQITGSLDETFNAASVEDYPGYVYYDDFGLTNMGPIHAYALNEQDDIFIAYKNMSTGFVDVAKIYDDGSGLIQQFGTNGIISDALNGAIPASVSDIRLAVDNQGRLVVAIATGSDYKLARYFAVTGLLDTDFGTAGFATSLNVGSTTVLTKLTILSNNKILLTGYDNAIDDSMLVVKLLSTGALDITFNSQGTTPGVLPLQIGNSVANYDTRVATGLAVQTATGNLIISGYEGVTSTEITPLVMRVYGESGTTEVPQFVKSGTTDDAGIINTAFGNAAGAHDFTSAIAAGSAKVIYSYPSGNIYQGYMLVGVDTSDAAGTIIARVRQTDLALDTSFGSGTGKITLSGSVAGLQHISIDSDNKILVGGSTSGTTGWIRRLTADGVADISFTMPTGFKAVYDIAEQKSGRYIVGGTDTNDRASVVGFRDTGVVDTTFNPLAQGAFGSAGGLYNFAGAIDARVASIAIDSDDTILAAYKTSANKVFISKLTANGSSLVSSFGSSGEVNTMITPTDALSIRLAIDGNGKVVVASSVGGNSVSVVRYTTAGATDSSFNSNGSVLNITGLGSAGVTLARLMTDDNNKIIIIGNNTDAGYGVNGNLYAARLDSDGVLDLAWNVSPIGTDVAGILTYDIANTTHCYDATIFIDGTIYVAALGTTNKPLLVSIFGDNYAGITQQEPFALAAGVIDTTLDGTAGALNLDTYLSSLDLSSSTGKKIYIYNDGSMLLGFNQGTTTVIVKLKKDFSLDTSFGTSGATTIANADTITDLFVSENQLDSDIYLVGTNVGALWTERLSSEGVISGFNLPNTLSMTTVNTIRRTTNSRTLVAGYAAGGINKGIIAAYKADGSGLDLSFGNGLGYYTTGVASPIIDMVVNQYDEMFIAYKSGDNIRVDYVLPNGSGLIPSLNNGNGYVSFSPENDVYSATQIRLILDTENNNFIVAGQDGISGGNTIEIFSFSLTNDAWIGNGIFITNSNKVLNLSNLFIDSSQNVYVVGSNATDSNVFVARAISGSNSFSLDTTYAAEGNTPGVADVNPGANMTTVVAGALHPDRRIYFLGNNTGNTTPSIARLFGDVYTFEIAQSQVIAGVAGESDNTFNHGSNNIVISNLTDYEGRVIYTNVDGSCFIAFGDGTNLKVGKFDGDFNIDTSFGDAASGLTAALAMASVNSLIVDSNYRILVSGTTVGGAQKVVRFSADGTTTTTVFTSALSCTVGNQIVEQKSGRILVAGKKGSNGTVNAYKNDGSGDDASYGSENNIGFYATGVNSSVDDMVVDLYDNTYITYRDGSNNVILEKIAPSGSHKVVAFNSGLAVTTSIVATQPVRMAINSDGNILVGATTDSSTIKTALYNGTTGAIIGTVQSIAIANSPILTNMTGCGTDFALSVYTTDPSMKVVKILGVDGTADSAFGTSGIGSATSEIATAMHGIAVQPDGRILMTGTDGSDPVTMRFYGNPYQAPYAQYPGAEVVGTVDSTLFPPSGALNLDTHLSSGDLNLDTAKVKRMYEYGNGIMLLVCENATDTILVRMNRDLTLDTTFNTNGYVTIAGKIDARGLVVTSSGEIVVAGGATTSWVHAYNSDGSTLTGWNSPTDNLTGGAYEVAKQSNDRVILVGKNSNGTLYGYTNGGILDPSFGDGGVVTTGVPFSIADVSIDSLDRIIIVSPVAGGSVLKRISADGDTITSLSGTAVSNITGNEVKVIQDISGNIIVAAATTTGFKLRRYDSDGVDNGSQITITAGGSSTSHLGNIYVTSDNKIVLVGYETTGGNVIVARIAADFSGLDSSFNGGSILSTTVGNMDLVYDGTIHIDGTIMIAGGSSTAADPYMARVFGGDYVTVVDQFPAEGIAGTIDETFETSGEFDLSLLDNSIVTSQARAVFTLQDGGHYIAFGDGLSASQLIKITSSGTLDENYNNNYGATPGVADEAPLGLHSMMRDGSGRIILTGTDDAGWMQRYTTDGITDVTFGINGVVSWPTSTSANNTVELSFGRLVVAGKNTNGVLRAYTNTGVLDTSFNSLGATRGEYSTGITNGIYALAADSNDRLIIAYLNGTNIDLARLRSSGVLDTSFGSGGIVSSIIANADEETQVRLVLNSAGNIVIAAHINDGANKIAVKSYDNLNAASGNGAVVNAQYDISGLVTPVLSDMIATQDGNVLILGTQSGTNPMWIARIVLDGSSAAALDTVGFNPDALGGTAGVFTYAGNGTTGHPYNAIAARYDGRISIVGSELSGSTYTPYLLRMYNSSYDAQELQSPNSQPVGSNDITLGLAGQTEVTFYALSATESDTAAQLQVARAVSLQDDNRYVIALDGQSTEDTSSRIFLNSYNIDGTLDTTFNSTGQIEVLPHTYEQEYVTDMITFVTAEGVNKAIIAGYATNTTLSVTNSLLMQYNLTSPALDSGFGGLNGNPSGVAFGDGQTLQVIGRQSSGRIIGGGLDQSNNGLLFGYTTAGKLDKSFGSDGCFVQGTTGIYSHAIDSLDRVIICYNDGSDRVAVARVLADGSGLDTTFGLAGIVTIANRITGISGNSNFKVAIDSDDKIVIAVINNFDVDCVVRRYNTDGSVDVSLTVASADLGTITALTISKLLIDTAGKITVVGYDDTTTDQIVVFRTNVGITALDTTFNPIGTPGYIKYNNGVSQAIIHALVHPDGRIMVVGSQG